MAEQEAPNVWRLRMKSGKPGVSVSAARDFALREGIVGAGWGPEDPTLADGCLDANEYLKAALIDWPNDESLLGAFKVFSTQMKVGDYCWIYVTDKGEYWCSEITGEFVYRTGGLYSEHDLHMVRACKWKLAGSVDAVPGVIRRAFAGPFGTISRLTTGLASLKESSEALFTERTSSSIAFYDVVTPDDLEDVFSLYLQDQGWRLLPSTAKNTMANYEFIMVHENSLQRAGVQVKSGRSQSLQQEVADDLDIFFVLMANEDASVAGDDPRISVVKPSDIEKFAAGNWGILPRRLQRLWLPKVLR